MKEKKEIWKLIELLNEYEKEVKKSEFYEWEKWVWWPTNLFRRDTRDDEWSHIYSATADTYVISKKYGFIKWLVENDKIDLDMVREQLWVPCFTRHKKWEIIAVKDVEDYQQILMLLSISNSPIEDLVLYLK